MTDPWGADEPSALTGPPPPLPPRLARLAEVAQTGEPLRATGRHAGDFPSPGELPEVQELVRDGWHVLDGAPLYYLVPAAWPAEFRAWVPDRLPQVEMGMSSDGYAAVFLPPSGEADWRDQEIGGWARHSDLPEPPPRRIWLLRSPWPSIPVTVVLDVIYSRVPSDSGPDEIGNVYRAAREVLTWTADQVRAACTPRARRLLREYAAGARSAESVSAAVELGMAPEEWNAALDRTGVDERTLRLWATELGELDETAIEFVTSWRAAGLPDAPPADAQRYLDRNPIELRAWLDAGFDLHAAERLEYAGLATAIHWRDEGFTPAETYELLRADPDLTIEEARSFDDAGRAADRKADWIYYGFNASDAAAWSSAGLSPSNARLWRAAGQSPGDVSLGDEGPPIPPRLIEGREYFAIGATGDGDITSGPWGEVPDPPGTRGRGARRARGDRHPWINSD